MRAGINVAPTAVLKLDHLSIVVADWRRSRDWYVSVLGMKLEFELAERGVAALQDDGGLTLFVGQGEPLEPGRERSMREKGG